MYTNQSEPQKVLANKCLKQRKVANALLSPSHISSHRRPKALQHHNRCEVRKDSPEMLQSGGSLNTGTKLSSLRMEIENWNAQVRPHNEDKALAVQIVLPCVEKVI